VNVISDPSGEFVQRLVDSQRGLYAYILQLLPNRTDADDVLQATNLVIWSVREQFVEGSNFAAWAARIAYFQVLTHRKRKSRERLCFDDSLVYQLSREAEAEADQMDLTLQMLRRCMDKLRQPDLDLLHMQYADGVRPREIARQLGRSPGAITQATHRIRMSLLECIEEQGRSAEEAEGVR
jgi:RNA polymerase sigma-70 factor (ECF subfamily)